MLGLLVGWLVGRSCLLYFSSLPFMSLFCVWRGVGLSIQLSNYSFTFTKLFSTNCPVDLVLQDNLMWNLKETLGERFCGVNGSNCGLGIIKGMAYYFH